MIGAASRVWGSRWAWGGVGVASALLAACDGRGGTGAAHGAETCGPDDCAPVFGSTLDAGSDSSKAPADTGSDTATTQSAPADASPDTAIAADSSPDTAPDASSSSTSGYAIPLTAAEGADYEYSAQVTVGNQTFAMQIDTGSTTAAVAGTTCSGCTGVSPLYTPSSSATATGQTATSEYADTSGWSGPIYADTVALGGGSPSTSLDLVDITTATGDFFLGLNIYQGIIGLGPSGNAIAGTTGYMPTVMSAGVPNVFALELCDDDGTMWLGGDGAHGAATVYTPLLPISSDNPYYAMSVDGMSLGGTVIAANASATFQQGILDTGTALFYVPTTVFDAFQTALEASSGFTALFGTSTFATSGADEGCVTDASVTDAEVESMLPPITISLPNATSGQPDVTIHASALDTYLYDGGGGQFCLAIQDSGSLGIASIFGDAFLQAFDTVIDLQAGRVGFSPTGCPTPQFRVRHPRKGPPRLPHVRRR